MSTNYINLFLTNVSEDDRRKHCERLENALKNLDSKTTKDEYWLVCMQAENAVETR